MVSDMGRVLVRKAEGDDKAFREGGNLPKPLSEMTDEERKKYGMPSRADQRSGKALNIRGRKGVTSVPQVPREERGKGRSAEDKVTDIPEALQMNPKTGAVRVRDRAPIEYSPEEMAAAEADYARRQEEMGPAIRGRQREAFEETDEGEREKRDIGASFRAGLDARRTIMQGQEDSKTGERRQRASSPKTSKPATKVLGWAISVKCLTPVARILTSGVSKVHETRFLFQNSSTDSSVPSPSDSKPCSEPTPVRSCHSDGAGVVARKCDRCLLHKPWTASDRTRASSSSF